MKTIIFDIGGVVVSTKFEDLYEGFARASGIDLNFIKDYHKNNWADLLLGNISLQNFFTAFQKAAKENGSAERLRQIWMEAAAQSRVINYELLDWIDASRGQYKIGVLSNLTFSRMILDQEMDLYSHFDFLVLSCVDRLKKPDPAIYQLALKRAGTTASESVFIDDKAEYVAAAKQLGIKDLLYVNNRLLFEELKQF